MEESTYLPMEIVVMILSRLPAKSLVRFKSVSKSWNALISSPSFIHTHLLHSKTSNSHTRFITKTNDQKLCFFQLHDGKFLPDVEPDMSELPNRINDVLCSCNGVLLFGGYLGEELFLWNPSIEKINKLHIPSRFRGRVGYGLCYYPISADLKIVVASWEKYAVNSCKNKSWSKPRKGLDGYDWCIYGRNVVCVDGAMYWKSFPVRWGEGDGHSGDLVCYESEKDELKRVQKPESLKPKDEFWSICLRDEFCVLFCDVEECMVKIWRRRWMGGRSL